MDSCRVWADPERVSKPVARPKPEKAAPKERVDALLVSRGLLASRARAQALIMAGEVYVGELRVEKPGQLVPSDAPLRVRVPEHPYVSRGGLKLEGALGHFAVDAKGKRCLDVGASTGGFSDCLLQRGASQIVAVDVGHGQLAEKLRQDPRVLSKERTNARTLTPEDIGGLVDLVVVDASFIGLSLLLPAIARCLREGGELVALIKPQFEVGKQEATRVRGVIRDEEVRQRVITEVAAQVEAAGLSVLGTCNSSLAGPKGNLEAFVYARRSTLNQR
jgi:23S rRNA (cytidine1920-2'-O)/16S rRNA (cytidine1409-2'-O)-methyltransferase